MHCSLTVYSERENMKSLSSLQCTSDTYTRITCFPIALILLFPVHSRFLLGGMELLLRLLLMWQSECALWIYVIYKVNRWNVDGAPVCVCMWIKFNEERQLHPSGECSVMKLSLSFPAFFH